MPLVPAVCPVGVQVKCDLSKAKSTPVLLPIDEQQEDSKGLAPASH